MEHCSFVLQHLIERHPPISTHPRASNLDPLLHLSQLQVMFQFPLQTVFSQEHDVDREIKTRLV